MERYAEQIYILIHHCHEHCLKLMRAGDVSGNRPSATGLSTRQGVILKYLLDTEGHELTQKEITRRLEITSSSCGALIAKLEQGGYLTRHQDPDDKRTFVVSLTPSGRVLAELYKEECATELEEWASDLTHQEQRQLFVLLGKLSKGLEARL